MRRLLSALGVDYAQWKALTVTALKLDLRVRRGSGARARKPMSATAVLTLQLLFYLFMGAVVAAGVWIMADRFTAALILTSYVFMMIGTAMLVDHSAAIISPDDYNILGFQPITSRTFFAARLTNVLVYTLAMTTAVGLLPALVFFVKHGFAVGVAAVLAVYGCALTVTLAIVVGYAWLVQRTGMKRLRDVLSFVQLIVGFVTYASFFLVSDEISASLLQALSIPRTPWLLLYPGAWFASMAELAAGNTTPFVIAGVLAAVTAFALLGRKLGGRLTLEYAAFLGALTTAAQPAAPPVKGAGRTFWFRRGEARAVAILVRSHFRNDTRFRTGVFAILPLTLIYLFIGLRSSNGSGEMSNGGLGTLTMAMLLFPSLLKSNLTRSDAFLASWLFFATPASRTRLIRSSKNVLVAFFLVPYLALVGLVLAWFLGDLRYVATYIVLTGLLSHLGLLFVTLADPELPFSIPNEKGRSTSRIFLFMIIIGILSGFMPWLTGLADRDFTAALIIVAIIGGVSALVSRLTRVRVERLASALEFHN